MRAGKPNLQTQQPLPHIPRLGTKFNRTAWRAVHKPWHLCCFLPNAVLSDRGLAAEVAAAVVAAAAAAVAAQ